LDWETPSAAQNATTVVAGGEAFVAFDAPPLGGASERERADKSDMVTSSENGNGCHPP
jgi:hypothetical protein